MSSQPLGTLVERFGSVLGIQFRQVPSGLLVVDIDTPLTTAQVSLYGGQVVAWHPRHQSHPVLWVAERAHYEPGKAIRGGVPICWPWFGSHPIRSDLPGHGYARISPWGLDDIHTRVDGALVLSMTLQTPASAAVPWPQPVRLHLGVAIGSELEIMLSTSNLGSAAIEFTEGLHSYFTVGDIAQAEVRGLEGAEYVDLLSGNELRRQHGPITFSGELGRIFLDSTAECGIVDPVLRRRIGVAKWGSRSTAVWSPGPELAENMADLGPEGWRTMVCVEGANAMKNRVTLGAGAVHVHGARFRAASFARSA